MSIEMRYIIKKDESGTLKAGAFFEFYVPFADDVDNDVFPVPVQPPIWSTSVPDCVMAEVLFESDDFYECPVNPKHRTRSVYHHPYADMSNTTRELTELVPTTDSVAIVVTDEMREMLSKTEFRGFDFSHMGIGVCQPEPVENVILWELQFKGAACAGAPKGSYPSLTRARFVVLCRLSVLNVKRSNLNALNVVKRPLWWITTARVTTILDMFWSRRPGGLFSKAETGMGVTLYRGLALVSGL